MPEMLQRFLSTVDVERVERCLMALHGHGTGEWALTGGLAVEMHRARLGRDPQVRQLNDIDFVTTSFDCIPATLADDFLFRHVHPLDPPGKIIAQLVDAANALRIDVFRAPETIMSRTIEVDLPSGSIRVVALEDLLARTARLTLPLWDGLPVPAKHARDFLELSQLTPPAGAESAWADHRSTDDPATLQETSGLLHDLIARRPDLLTRPGYSQDPLRRCARCVPNAKFQLADPALILSILGYC